MLRLNTSIAPRPSARRTPRRRRRRPAGFPNGRRPGDDVVDLPLRVAMGALCVLTGPGDTFGSAASGERAFRSAPVHRRGSQDVGQLRRDLPVPDDADSRQLQSAAGGRHHLPVKQPEPT